MNIEQLGYFQLTASFQHMSKAADMLNISQSALGSNIRRLEIELGVPLFDRVGRNIVSLKTLSIHRFITNVSQSTRLPPYSICSPTGGLYIQQSLFIALNTCLVFLKSKQIHERGSSEHLS